MKPLDLSAHFWKTVFARYITFASIGLIAVLATGCTNNFRSGALYQAANTSNWGQSAASSTTTDIFGNSTSGFMCPDLPNVVPNYDYNNNGTDQYTVCSSTANMSEVVVHGRTEVSPVVCAFAAQYVDDQHIYAQPDLTSGLPWFQCADSSLGDGVGFIFANVNFNYLYIVEGPDQLTMQDCLITGNTIDCPSYSAGKFR